MGVLAALMPLTLALTQPAPTAPTAALEEMRTLLQEGLYALAAQVEGPALVEAMPESAEGRYLHAKALYLTGDLAAAQTQLEQLTALQLKAAEPEYAQLEALVAAGRGDLLQAQALLEATFAQTPSYSVAMDLGRVAWQAGNFAEALRAYRAAAQTPEGRVQPWPHLHQARLLSLQGDYGASIEAWNTALNVLDQASLAGRAEALPSPAYVEAFYGLGEAYEALGEPDEAAANYSAALAADPSFEPATLALERLNNTPR